MGLERACACGVHAACGRHAVWGASAVARLLRAREQSVAFDGFLNAALASYEEAFGHAPVFSDMKELGVMDSEMPKNLDDL